MMVANVSSTRMAFGLVCKGEAVRDVRRPDLKSDALAWPGEE